MSPTRRQLLIGAMSALTSSVALAACALPSPSLRTTAESAAASPTPITGGVLRVGAVGDIVTSGLPHVLTAPNYQLYPLIYDTLVTYDTHLNPQPALALRWEWSPDSRRIQFDLRPGVKFHTGRPFTSQDARSNLERLRDPALGSQWLNYARLMQVETPDAQTLIVNYDAPVRSSFDAFALTFMADPQTFDQTAGVQSFVGTGPFRFKEWVQGDHLSVVRNPDYWQAPKPYLDGVELSVHRDAVSAVAALEAGSLDWLVGAPTGDARRLQTDTAYTVLLRGSGGSFYCVGLDVTAPLLADKRVRQAVAYAVNRPRMVESALDGFGRAASILWPQQSLAYDATEDQTYTFDLARAETLLQAAGWDRRNTVDLYIPTPIPPTKTMAAILQADLATAGMQVSLQELNGADFVARAVKGQFGGAFITPTSFMNLSPATFLTSAITVRVPNESNFASDRYSQLIQESALAPDDQTLITDVHEWTGILLDEAFLVPIAEGTGQLAGPDIARGNVSNIGWDGFGLVHFTDVWMRPPK